MAGERWDHRGVFLLCIKRRNASIKGTLSVVSSRKARERSACIVHNYTSDIRNSYDAVRFHIITIICLTIMDINIVILKITLVFYHNFSGYFCKFPVTNMSNEQ